MSLHTSLSAFLARSRIILALLAAALPLSAHAQQATGLFAESPQPAPALAYTTEDGITQRLPKARLTAVHFWAIWCAPCVAELPEVDAAQQAYGPRGFQVLAISLDGDNAMPKVQAFLAEHGLSQLKPALDYRTNSFNAAHVPGLPTTLFIDANGQEIARAEGPLDWKSAQVKAFIEGQLSAQP